MPDRKRLHALLPTATRDRLDELAADADVTCTEIVVRALRLYDWAVAEQAAGNDIGVRKNGARAYDRVRLMP